MAKFARNRAMRNLESAGSLQLLLSEIHSTDSPLHHPPPPQPPELTHGGVNQGAVFEVSSLRYPGWPPSAKPLRSL